MKPVWHDTFVELRASLMKLFCCPELLSRLARFFPVADQGFFLTICFTSWPPLWNWQSKQSDSNSVFCILFDGPVHGKTVCTVFMTGKPIVGPPKTSSDRLHLACFQFPIQFHVGLYLSDFQFPIQIFMYRPAPGWFSILSGPPLVWSGRE